MSKSDSEEFAASEPMGGQHQCMHTDGEEMSPMSPGMLRMLKGTDDILTKRDRATNGVAITLLVAVFVTAVTSIAAGACCLSSLNDKSFHRFPLFYAFGVTPVVLGSVALVAVIGVVLFIWLGTSGFSRYGMCFLSTKRSNVALRICLLGVFPFIVFLVLLAMTILGFVFFSLSQQNVSLTRDYYEVQGVSGPVQLLRDTDGLTHIKASSRQDAYFGQGFATAQDRLFQLEFHRLVAKGELSSLVGTDGVETDKGTRTINIRAAGAALCRNTDDQTRALLQSYVNGVNYFLKHVSKRPVEFFFMSRHPLYFHDPEPFTVEDICLTTRLYQWQLSSNVKQEGNRFAAWANTARTYSQVEELFPSFDNETHTILNQTQMLKLMGLAATDASTLKETLTNNVVKEKKSSVLEATVYDKLLSVLRSQLQSGGSGGSSNTITVETPQERVAKSMHRVMKKHFNHHAELDASVNKFLYASNAWAARDAQGHAMAASDPHLTINLPSVWYYTHLSFPTEEGLPFDTAGVGMVGLPGVMVGKTTNVAWGITLSMTDLEDLFILPPPSFSGLPSGTYRYDGQLRSFVTRRERIKVKGRKDIVLDIQDTVLGPVVSSMLGFPEALQVVLHAVPLSRKDNMSMAVLLGLSDPRLNTAEKFMDNLLQLPAPGFSIPIADVHGNIAHVITGRHPLRPLGHTGKFPTPAFDGPALLDQICRAVMAEQGHSVPSTESCSLPDGVLESLDIAAMLPKLQPLLQNSTWSSYVAVDAGAEDSHIPASANPHALESFDGTPAYIAAANQRILPSGYPYFFGADYSPAYRGTRIQELLQRRIDELGEQSVHMAIQMDRQSNVWMRSFADFVKGIDFSLSTRDAGAAPAIAEELSRWDASTAVGSTHTAFFWRWMQRMAVLPRDAVSALGLEHWPTKWGYIERMLLNPTELMLKECADYMNVQLSSNSCRQFITDAFVAQANEAGLSEQWGRDLNRMVGVHEMLEHKSIHPLFSRTMEKSGDESTVCVSDHSIDGDMTSTQASSVRQLYDLWNATGYMYVAFPGGNSGNPYSTFYDNLWYKYAAEEYEHVAISHDTWQSIQTHATQVLSP